MVNRVCKFALTFLALKLGEVLKNNQLTNRGQTILISFSPSHINSVINYPKRFVFTLGPLHTFRLSQIECLSFSFNIYFVV